jgi:hypothetical protein
MEKREKILISDFDNISKENEFFLLHFVAREKMMIGINSVIDYYDEINPLHNILDIIDIPYFETYLDSNSVDFLINLDDVFIKKVYRGGYFQPTIVAFNKKRMVGHTYPPNCLCAEGIIKIIGDLNPQYLINAKID